MSKDIKFPQQGQQSMPPINFDLKTAEDVTCNHCSNRAFTEVILMKKVSAIMSPSGKEGYIPIPTFACTACGFINPEFLPMLEAEESDE